VGYVETAADRMPRNVESVNGAMDAEALVIKHPP
jgi:hypothetical protein